MSGHSPLSTNRIFVKPFIIIHLAKPLRVIEKYPKSQHTKQPSAPKRLPPHLRFASISGCKSTTHLWSQNRHGPPDACSSNKYIYIFARPLLKVLQHGSASVGEAIPAGRRSARAVLGDQQTDGWRTTNCNNHTSGPLSKNLHHASIAQMNEFVSVQLTFAVSISLGPFAKHVDYYS